MASGTIDALGKYIEFGLSSKTLQENLETYWETAIPNTSQPVLVRINAMYGMWVGVMNLYQGAYGSGLITRYTGSACKISLDNGTVTVTYI